MPSPPEIVSEEPSKPRFTMVVPFETISPLFVKVTLLFVLVEEFKLKVIRLFEERTKFAPTV